MYCATKHALLGFSRAIHDELKEHNVRTLCISPSSTQSKMGLATKGQDYSTFLDPSDVAEYVVFAISFDSNIVSEEIFLKRMIVQ
jgi:short-subunit dehydrogenase